MTPTSRAWPMLNGVVLCGGKSSRMGEDKGSLSYSGLAERSRCIALLKRHCERVFLSCRRDQHEYFTLNEQLLVDEFEGIGPAAGLLSAHRNNSQCAWLVVACDLPLLRPETVQLLVLRRNGEKAATLLSLDGEIPEPAIAIWEPVALRSLEAQVQNRRNGLRECLSNLDVETIAAPNGEHLLNANSPGERAAALKKLES